MGFFFYQKLSDRHRADRDQDRPGRPSALILATIQQQTDQQYPPRRSASQKARQRIQEGRHAVFVDVIHQLTADQDQEGRRRFSFYRLAVADLQTRPQKAVRRSQKAVSAFSLSGRSTEPTTP